MKARPWKGRDGRSLPLDPEHPLIATEADLALGSDGGGEALRLFEAGASAQVAGRESRRSVRRAVRELQQNGGWVAAPQSPDPLVNEYGADATLVELPEDAIGAAHAVLRGGVDATGRPVIALARGADTPVDALIAALDAGAAGVVVGTGESARDAALVAGARDRETTRLDRAPLFSVVICNFNGSRFIDRALDAVAGILYPDFEVLFVDDGSTDDSVALAANYPVKVLELPRGGLSRARNAGIAAAGGEFVLFLDNDAVAEPLLLARLWRLMDRLGADGAGGPNLPFEDAAWQERVASGAPGPPLPLVTVEGEALHLPGCNMAFRKSALEAIGGFDHAFVACGDDIDLEYRLLQAGYRLYMHPAAIVWHHRRDTMRGFLRQQWSYGACIADYEARHGERNVIPLKQLTLRERLDPRRRRPVFLGAQAEQLYVIAGHELKADLPLRLLRMGGVVALIGAPLAWEAGQLGRWALLVGALLVAGLGFVCARVPVFGAKRGWSGLAQRIATASMWLAMPVAHHFGYRAGRRRQPAQAYEPEPVS